MLLLCVSDQYSSHCSWHSSVENSQVRKEVYSTKDTQLDKDIYTRSRRHCCCAARHNYRCLSSGNKPPYLVFFFSLYSKRSQCARCLLYDRLCLWACVVTTALLNGSSLANGNIFATPSFNNI